jgi:hypothetical protein
VASKEQEERRRDALTAFIEARLDEGYLVETRTDTHAIIGRPGGQAQSFLSRLRAKPPRERQVVAVDADAVVTMAPAEPLRS